MCFWWNRVGNEYQNGNTCKFSILPRELHKNFVPLGWSFKETKMALAALGIWFANKWNMLVFGIQDSSTSRESWKWNPVMLHSGRRHDRQMHVMWLSQWRTNFFNSWVYYSSFIHPITISFKLIQQHYSATVLLNPSH